MPVIWLVQVRICDGTYVTVAAEANGVDDLHQGPRLRAGRGRAVCALVSICIVAERRADALTARTQSWITANQQRPPDISPPWSSDSS